MGSPVYVLDKQQKDDIVTKIRERLTELHLNLDLYGFSIKATENAVYKVGVGIGVEFNCIDWQGLTQKLESHPKFIKDDENTLIGCFMALKTKGTGFRQKGAGESVHFQINRNSCDVHIDSHGVVNEEGQYSLVGMMAHLPWDLLPFMTRNHGYVRLGYNVLLAPTAGFSPSFIAKLNGFYDNGLKGPLPTLRELRNGVQLGYDVQIMGHTRAGGVLSYDESYDLRVKPSFTFDTIGERGRLTFQLSPTDVAASAALNFGTGVRMEAGASKTFNDPGSAAGTVMIWYKMPLLNE